MPKTDEHVNIMLFFTNYAVFTGEYEMKCVITDTLNMKAIVIWVP